MKINPEYVREHLPDIVNEETGMKWITRSAQESDTIVIETKYDGECCFIEKRDGKILVSNKGKTTYDTDFFQSRNHDDFYTEMLEAFTLDGIYMAELIAGDGNVNQFNLYQSAIADGSKGKLRAKVYDIIELENQEIWSAEFLKRRKLLTKVINENDSVQIVDNWELNPDKSIKERLIIMQDTFDIITKEDNMEGMIIKFPNKWIKKKVTNTVDAVVIGIKKTKEWEENHIARSFLLGLKNGESYHIIGCLSSGFTHEQLENDMPIETISKWTSISNPDSIRSDDYIPVNPSIVLECKYLSFGEKLRQPRLVRIRTDKTPDTCNMNQIRGL